MGLEYIPCNFCDETIINGSDEDYVYCKCGNSVFCGECVEEYKNKYGITNYPGKYVSQEMLKCPECDPEMVTDKHIFEWLLKKSGLTRSQIMCEILAERK
jgi:hypothetical protein